MIPYGRQEITEEDIKAVAEALRSDYLTQGPKVAEFEAKLASYCGAEYAVAFANGTAALHGAYYAAGLEKGDSFITTPMTFAATSNAGLYLGASPRFCDVEPDTGNIDTDGIPALIDKSVRLIAPVHYSGMPADMERVRAIADENGLMVVEDACHALGAVYKGERIGNCAYSDMTVFSFHPVKHVATGEGGAVLTNDENLRGILMRFRSHGITRESLVNEPHGGWYHEMQELGYNYRITDIQCALGISQLSRAENSINRRRQIAARYDAAFNEIKGLKTPPHREERLNAYHLYPLRIENGRREVYDLLREKGVYAQVHYLPVYMHPYYRANGFESFTLPEAEKYYKSELSIPMFPSLTDEEQEYVIKCVTEAMQCVSG
ncbi:UDP-4-amino-4,6-dideoxy-N-acetyl-beta-L-altrosamine transaminase [Geovibrio thiophilus]|uniref:UDP-4-amino-4, 6-dideoxy-N-acetyl-beta-L-altrosamine transaminase n=1 Tax=Geovibrio thiophilus TaxID=139438 RepID=A0A410K2P1_9BACT|nr:UDP-4-amino-4,6-dideoxy-N-acetyl-beta-L-altrosamine transaminase [Geovibrio thiophilus]